jgi:sigma-54 dependent transcriptional regulator, acetoin dehydrogenase operon transcriptional activator AcoR
MAGTLKEALNSDPTPHVRLLTVVMHFDDALSPPGLVFAWTDKKLAIGRAEADEFEDGKLGLMDPRVSTAHAELERRGDEVLVRDLGSSNGTWVNGGRVEGERELRSGDLIELGRTVLCYRETTTSLAWQIIGKKGRAQGVSFGAMRTFNPELGEKYRKLTKVASSAQPVLVVGETGTGKDVLSNELHEASGRKGPFVAVDCGAIPDSLFESTLFGHEKGAFTGATEARVGEIVRATKGTLLLDEVGNLTPAGQAKLLRVLETSKVTALGGARTQDVDVRWLAATNRQLMQEGDGFRSDLLHRLAGFVMELPPLRERKEDLGLLLAHLLAAAGVKKASLHPLAGRALVNHALGGNVRQLRNIVQRAAHAGAEVVIDLEALGQLEQAEDASSVEPERPREGGVPGKAELETALTSANGNVAQAARSLGTSARQLYRWLGRAGLDPENFRAGKS